MVIVRIYQMLDALVVESTAQIRHDGLGNPTEPRAAFIGREYFDASGAVGPAEVSEAVYGLLDRAGESICAEFGGLHQLL